jgi:hypothetical protein
LRRQMGNNAVQRINHFDFAASLGSVDIPSGVESDGSLRRGHIALDMGIWCKVRDPRLLNITSSSALRDDIQYAAESAVDLQRNGVFCSNARAGWVDLS